MTVMQEIIVAVRSAGNEELAVRLEKAQTFHKTKLHSFLNADPADVKPMTEEEKEIRKAQNAINRANKVLAKYSK